MPWGREEAAYRTSRHIERVYEAFGPKRLVGVDCPFQCRTKLYADGLSLLRDRLDFLFRRGQRMDPLGNPAEETFF